MTEIPWVITDANCIQAALQTRAGMGIYSRHIFPRLVEWSLNREPVNEARRVTLASLRGHILEVGFGTGLNLACYPPAVTRVTAIDSVNMLLRRVSDRIDSSPMRVERFKLDAAGRLPFDESSFDGVVTTFTLCSIDDVTSALAEIKRVLSPEAEYVFLEHGCSDDSRIARRQALANPITRLIGCGCRVNRRIDCLIRAAGFKIAKLDRFVMPDSDRVLGEMYRGIATK